MSLNYNKHFGRDAVTERLNNRSSMHRVREVKRTLAPALIAGCFGFLLGVSQVQAQPEDVQDLSDKDKPYGWGYQPPDTKQRLTCLVANDFYIVHFTSYLEPLAGEKDPKKIFKQHCQDLPRVGKAYLGIDLMDMDARGLPVGVKVVEVQEGERPKDAQKNVQPVLLDIAPKVYESGVVEVQSTFDKPGLYSVNLAFDAGVSDEDVLKIPLRVGLEPEKEPFPKIPLEIPVGLTILGVVGFFSYHYIKKKRQG
jgi:hypothetical protein